MTAAQLVAPRRFELVQVPAPQPARGQVRVAVEGCGVCASNLPAWAGRPWFAYPLAPGQLGHEGWGRVEALGPSVASGWLGQRVAMLSEHAYAECDVAAVDDLVALPDDGPGMAPLEPFACLFNIARRAEFQAGTWLAVVGLGFIGLGLARLAQRAGARVLALSANAAALERARAAGIEAGLSLHDPDLRERIAALTGGTGCPCVIECTGHQEPLDVASDVVGEGGRLVIAGYHQDGPRQVDLQQWNWKGIDVINAHERSAARVRAGMHRAADALAREPEWVGELVTHRFPLSAIDAALDSADRRPAGFVKGAVLMAPEPEL